MIMVVERKRRKRRNVNVCGVLCGVNVDQPEENDDNK
jgi:hypothetical protein